MSGIESIKSSLSLITLTCGLSLVSKKAWPPVYPFPGWTKTNLLGEIPSYVETNKFACGVAVTDKKVQVLNEVIISTILSWVLPALLFFFLAFSAPGVYSSPSSSTITAGISLYLIENSFNLPKFVFSAAFFRITSMILYPSAIKDGISSSKELLTSKILILSLFLKESITLPRFCFFNLSFVPPSI